jgi:Cu/Zn superoxide dismutase
VEAHGGRANVDLEDKMISLIGKDSIIGRSMMVHAKEDDMTKDADPGPRLACGVIGLAKGHNGDDVDGKWTTMDPILRK